MKIKILDIASALLFFVGILLIFHAFQDFFNPASLHEGFLDVTNSQISAFSQDVMNLITSLYQFNGVRLVVIGLFFCVTCLIPYRKGEKWAWYLMLIVGGFGIPGQLVIIYIYSPIMNSLFTPIGILLLIVWAIGIILPIKEIFKK